VRSPVAGRDSLHTTLSGRSPITGRVENVFIITMMMRSGDIFYIAAVAPSDEWNTYRPTFDSIFRSVQLNDGY
jgi:hypothetical protein